MATYRGKHYVGDGITIMSPNLRMYNVHANVQYLLHNIVVSIMSETVFGYYVPKPRNVQCTYNVHCTCTTYIYILGNNQVLFSKCTNSWINVKKFKNHKQSSIQSRQREQKKSKNVQMNTVWSLLSTADSDSISSALCV